MRERFLRCLWTATLVLISLGTIAFSVQAQTVEYVHTDALGTPVAITNVAGVVIERSEYEPYGKLLNRPHTNGPGFTGHVEDAATGLTYMQQRYYDPMCGCFLSVDPVTAYSSGDMRFFNRYAYAFNNPYKFTDPDGRQSWSNTGTANPWPAVQQACGGSNSCEQEVAVDLTKAQGAILAGAATLAIPDPTDVALGGLLARMGFSRVPAAYRLAAEGGRHHGFLRQQLGKTPVQLQRTIRSIEKRIAEHQDKINNPGKYMTRDDASVPGNVERARRDWAGDIKRQTEQRDIAKEVLRRADTCTGTRIKGNC